MLMGKYGEEDGRSQYGRGVNVKFDWFCKYTMKSANQRQI